MFDAFLIKFGKFEIRNIFYIFYCQHALHY